MTDRQIAASVFFGRKITLWPLDQDSVHGYVAGMDRFNIFMLVPRDDGTIEQYIVHKGSTPLIELHMEKTVDTEPQPLRRELKKIIFPFRRRIVIQFYPNMPVPTGPDDDSSADVDPAVR